VIGLWVLCHEDRRGRWAFFTPALLVAAIQCFHNVWFFDTLTGGYAAIEKMHPWAHGTKGTWTAPFLEGAAGTLLSPSHGLFVYCPWVALALALLPWSAGRIASEPADGIRSRPSDSLPPLRGRVGVRGRHGGLPESPLTLSLPHQGGGDQTVSAGACLAQGTGNGPGSSLARWVLWALVPYFVLLSKYSCWWGGHCFGPRFWIDVNPVLALVVAAGLDWARDRCRPALIGLALAAAVAIGCQAVGFLCYPSSWHGAPENADRHHERLWDWRDSELTRCWREGIRPRSW
jgi:hypothetical protein